MSTAAHGGVVVHVPLRSAADAAMPPMELLFQPLDETPGDLVIAAAEVTRDSDGAVTATAVPQLTGDGSWRVWWAVAGAATPPAVALPWSLRRSASNATIEPAD